MPSFPHFCVQYHVGRFISRRQDKVVFCPSPPPNFLSILSSPPLPSSTILYVLSRSQVGALLCGKIGMPMRKLQKGVEFWGKFPQMHFVIGFLFSPPHKGVECILQNIRFAEVAFQSVLFFNSVPTLIFPLFSAAPFLFFGVTTKNAYRHVDGILVLFLLVCTSCPVPRHFCLLV